MSIQRTGYEINVHQHNTDREQLLVEMVVECRGEILDRGDALLMIGEAWSDAMRELGLDPLKSLITLTTEGTMQ